MSIYNQYKPQGDNDLYLKLLDGDRIKGRIASEPAISVYQDGQKPRYSWIVFVREKNGKPVNKPQILTKGISVYTGIADVSEAWGEEPTDFDIAIKRTGSGLSDTEYSVNPVKESEDLTESQKTEIAKIDLPQAIKGKWLADFVEDNELPNPIVAGLGAETLEKKDEVHEVLEGEPIDLEMPPDFGLPKEDTK